MDIANIGLGVDSSGLVKGTKRLKDFERQSRHVENAVTRMGRAVKGALGGVAIALGAGFSVAGIIRLSDEYTSLINMLKVVEEAQGNVNDTLSKLNGIAERTRAPLNATAKLYQRISVAGAELGASQQDILRFTENVGLALAQQGGGAAQASGALLQLSQAMGGGVVRAEEFNSILEGAYPIALAAAKGLDAAGGSVSKLRNLVIEGKVSSEDFFQAILSQTDDLEAAFANTTPTIGQAMSRLGDSMMLFIGGMNESTGASEGLARAILGMATAMGRASDWVRENGDTIKEVIRTVIGSALIYGTGLMISFGLSALTAGGQVGILTGALGLLKSALITTGVGALIVAAGYLVGKFLELSDAVGGFGNAMYLVKELGLEVWERLGMGAVAMEHRFAAITASIRMLFTQAFSAILKEFAKMIASITLGLAKLLMKANQHSLANAIIATGAEITAATEQMQTIANASIDAQRQVVESHSKIADDMTDAALKPLYVWQSMVAVIDAAQRKAAGEFGVPSAGGVTTTTDPTDPGNSGGGAGADSDALAASQQFIDSLQDELLQLTLTEEAYRRMEVSRAAAMAPTPEMAEQIRLLGEMREVTLAQAEADERLNVAKATLEDYQFQLDLMGMTNEERARAIAIQELERQGIVAGTEAWERYGKAVVDAAGKLATANTQTISTVQALRQAAYGFGELADVLGDSLGRQSAAFKAMFALQKAFSIASSLIAINTAAGQVLADPSKVTLEQKLAAWGVIAAQGASIIANIQSLTAGFQQGGYTGPGAAGELAGVVHKGEVVWSQNDVARHGGWQNVDAMRCGMSPANDNGGRVKVEVGISVDDDGRIRAYVTEASSKAVDTAVSISDQRTNEKVQASHAATQSALEDDFANGGRISRAASGAYGLKRAGR